MGTPRGIELEPPASPSEIRDSAQKILHSPGFSNSPRRAQLLTYLIERTLAGQGDQITEYAIALDVFGKPSTFDPRVESVVRTEFSRVRQKLKEYYAGAGQKDAIWIEFPQRGYVPAFTVREALAKPSAAPNRRRGLWLWIAAAAAVLVLTTAALLTLRPAPAPPISAVVVLPFQNLSPDRGDQYLADGVTEELTNDLAQSKDLRVVARTSASLFKGKAVDVREVGRKLNVGVAIEGSFAREPHGIRITAQMNRTADGYHLWSHSYQTQPQDIIAVQQEIAQSIVSVVRGSGHNVPALAAGSTKDPVAHDLYLRAYYLALNRTDSLRESLALFQQATTKDPAYVNAYIGIARVEISLIHMTEEAPEQAVPIAKAALAKALQLDPSSGDARGLLADLIAVYDWDWPRAEREFQQALTQGAQSPTRSLYGSLLATRGRFREAQVQLRMAQDVDPLGMGPRYNQFVAFYLEHNYSEAARILRSMLQMHPDQFDARFMLGVLAIAQHDCAAARNDLEWSARTFPAPVTTIGLSLFASCSGDRRQALADLTEAAKPSKAGYTSPYQLALGYAAAGRNEEALSYLEQSATAREMQIFYLKYEPLFDSIRSQPRFLALERRVGLPE